MADPRDKTFLRVCLDKRLLDQELADSASARARSEGRRVTAVLVDLGVMAQHTVEAIEREVERALEPRTIAGFRIMRKLGQGGMGTVYLAVQVSLQREVALKIIAPQIAADREAAERFVREARIAAAVNHPNIIGIIDAGEDGGQLFMALELITGGDASQLAARFNGVLPEARALEIIADCCRGLQALYEARLIHRDIKPANIFITGEGVAKLADLGLARSEGGDDRLTVSGFAVGTPAFMSPEQANGEAGIDIRSDIYALGATLFALATGSQPFTGKGPFAIAAKVLTQPVPDPRALNPALSPATAAVILRAMAKKAEQRFQTPDELRLAIEAAAAGLAGAPIPRPGPGPASSAPASATAVTMLLGEPAPPPLRGAPRIHSSPRTQRSLPRTVRRRWPAVLAALAVLAVLSVPILFNRRDGQLPGHAPAPVVAPPPVVATHAVETHAGEAPADAARAPAPAPDKPPPALAAAPAPAVAKDPAAVTEPAPDARSTVPPAPPAWAAATGQDGYGAWADLRIGAAIQRLRWIDAGTFLAGSAPGEAGHAREEGQQEVTISRGFWLADSACTQGLWLELMGSNPSVLTGNPRLPVENLRFEEAEAFLQRLSQRIAGSRARLPTRCEYEYAGRAGSRTAWFFGDDAAPIAAYANVKDSGPGHPLPVNSLKPNRWGLYDMLGNVNQWVYGRYAPLPAVPGPDPELAAATKDYLIRGGSYGHPAVECRSASISCLRRDSHGADIGFRFVIEQPGGAPTPAPAPDERATRPPAVPPAWAVASGQDGYGAWAELRIGAETQRLRWIDPGTFLAGSPPAEAGHVKEEQQKEVTISRGFWLADSECTQALWRELMGSNPSVHAGDPRLPVENMLFDEAEGFLQRLSQRTAGNLARLPTRAEFEYAERAGSRTAYYFGDDAALIAAYANVKDNGPGHPLTVRSRTPNAWGLYDMIGNVAEWSYGGIAMLSTLAGLDPELADRATVNAYHIRGGSYQHPAIQVRSASYGYLRRDSRNGDVGFRFLVEQAAKPEPSGREAVPGKAPVPAPAPGARGAKPPGRPPWAAAVGKDGFGSWADLRIGAETQRLRWIEAGSFMYGSPPSEKGRSDWEDQRQVTIAHGFWLADSACTQEVWTTVIGSNPSLHKGTPQLPVQRVSFDDALGFLDKLSLRLKGAQARLPTRAEWEYAARAGATTTYFYGDDPALAGPYANTKNSGPGRPIPVRSLKPNRWGLYDVMGNIQNWVYGGIGALPVGPNIDPELANRTALTVFFVRGGSCDQPTDHCRLAGGGLLPRDCRNDDLGLRILIEQAEHGAP
jgi:formylglycine-generating enzyme required for sulfatase activity/serine/threonine protein kinase